ncbi:MAG TPA: ribokinase [Micromonospora sp.]|nr:ribokinase [Micromonospora sp.]
MMSARVIVVGSANMDLVVTAPTLPTPGGTVLGHEFGMGPGGKGANQAIAATRAGASCVFIGAVGQDDFGWRLRDNLAVAGVELSRLRTVPGSSGVAMIAVDDQAENFIVVAPGANSTLSRLDGADRAAITTADVLLCQLEVPLPAVAQAATVAQAAGTLVMLNAAPARYLPPELLAAVDVLVVNQGEASIVAGYAGTESKAEPSAELLDALLGLVPRVVLTLGARGVVYADRNRVRLAVGAPCIEAVDTTGAGDAFTGALAVALAERRPIESALRWACAAGAACAQRPGASTALPTRDEIDELFVATYRMPD